MNILLSIFAVFLFFGAGIAEQVQGPNSDEYVLATANEFCMRTIALLDKKMTSIKLDPLFIQHMETNVTFNWLFQEHIMNINLTNIALLGLSTMAKGEGNCMINYDLRLLRINIPVDLNLLDVTSDFVIKALGFEPDGVITGKLTKEIINIVLLVDLKKTTFSLQDFQLDNTGKLDLHITGLGLLGNALANTVTDVVTALFKDSIMKTVQETVFETVDSLFNSLPPIIPEIPDEDQTSASLKFEIHYSNS